MFKTHFLSHDQAKENFFKKYNNKLNKIKELAKRTYFSTQFYLNKENIKMTWKLIGMITNRKKKSNVIICKIAKIVHALWLAERRVCMRVCKHGCVT